MLQSLEIGAQQRSFLVPCRPILPEGSLDDG
jgi:hypothetical protein